MVFEIESGQAYIYQPEAKDAVYAGRASRATVAEFVVFRHVTDEGLYSFERRDGSRFSLVTLKHIFKYQPYVQHKKLYRS